VERAEFLRAACRVMVAQERDTRQLVFVDEMGTNISLSPLYAWAPKGQRARCSMPRNRGANTPERHRHRRHETAHQGGRPQAALFQEEEGQVPAGHKRCQDRGGEKRRAVGLQTGQGDPVPARMLAQRSISGVDQAHREHHKVVKELKGEPSSRSPAQPWVRGITMRAAKSGPDGKNLTLSISKNAHEIA
jgi:hypothetical protein